MRYAAPFRAAFLFRWFARRAVWARRLDSGLRRNDDGNRNDDGSRDYDRVGMTMEGSRRRCRGSPSRVGMTTESGLFKEVEPPDWKRRARFGACYGSGRGRRQCCLGACRPLGLRRRGTGPSPVLARCVPALGAAAARNGVVASVALVRAGSWGGCCAGTGRPSDSVLIGNRRGEGPC